MTPEIEKAARALCWQSYMEAPRGLDAVQIVEAVEAEWPQFVIQVAIVLRSLLPPSERMAEAVARSLCETARTSSFENDGAADLMEHVNECWPDWKQEAEAAMQAAIHTALGGGE